MSNPCVHFSCLRPGCELDRVFPQDCRRGCSAYSPVEYFVVSVEARVSG